MKNEERRATGADARAASSGNQGGSPGGKAPLDEPPGGIFPNWRALYLTLLAYTGLAVLVLFLLTHVMNRGLW